MRCWKILLGVGTFLMVHGAGGIANAAVNYDWVTDNGNGNYTLLPNGSTAVQVYLRETLTAGSPSTLVTEGSLFSGVARVTRTTSPTDPARITASTPNPEFGGFSFSEVNASGAFADTGGSVSLAGTTNPTITQDSTTVRRVLIGTVTIQGGLIPLQTSVFTISDVPGQDSTLTNSGTLLDPLIVNRTFSVSVLPEPTTVGLGGMVLAGLLLRRRRAA